MGSNNARGMLYVKGGNGKYYQEIPKPDGDFDYIEAEPGLAFAELPDGKFMAVRDMEEYQRQRSEDSHTAYFERMQAETGDDPKKVKHKFKQLDALERQLQQFAIDRATVPTSPNVKRVTDNDFMRLKAEYDQAFREGRGKECEFQPLQTYANKLVTRSGTVVRPLFKGEVGMIGGTILCLEDGLSPENTVAVPDQIRADGAIIIGDK